MFRFVLGPILAMAVSLAACGGGSGSGGVAGSGDVDLFLSDTFADDFDQVWLTVHKAELHDSVADVFRTVFESADGVLFDARRLGDASGPRFSFLGTATVPNGSYDRVRITLKDEAVLVAAGSTTGQTKGLDDSLPRDGSGRPMAEYALMPPLDVAGPSGAVVIDFDLVNFVLDGNDDVVPSLRQGDDFGIESPERHEAEDYRGVVTNLSGNTFTLSPAMGAGIAVSFDATTPVLSDSNGQNATLANSQVVEVTGVFSALDRTLDALSIKIEDGTGPDEPEVHGAPTDLDLVANTLTLADIFMVEGFTPQGSTVAVVWTDGTVFRRSGDIVDETWLATFPFAEVKGTYDAATNTIAASRITLEDGDGRGLGEPEAQGEHVSVDLVGDAMVLTSLTVVVGFAPPGGSVNVRWTGTTVFRRSGDVVDETWLNSFAFSEVKGSYEPATNTLLATRITLEDDQETPPAEDEAEAAGTVGSLDLANDSMTLSSLSAVTGFTPQGGTVTVVWDAQTVFRFKGDVVDESLLATHPRAEARGTYNGGSNTLTADRISIKD